MPSSKTVKPGTVRKKDEFVAIKMDPSVTAGAWFVIHPKHGGGYSDQNMATEIESADGGWVE